MAGRGKRKAGDNGFEDQGGYMAAKISKLENQYLNECKDVSENELKSRIFSNVAIFVNGYTTPTAEELKRIMLANGGIYHHYLSSKTTHIIASNLCDAKIKKLKGDEKFIKPEWIVDSLEAQTLLDFKPYLLYTGTSDKGQQKLALVTVSKKYDDSNPPQPLSEKKIGAESKNVSPESGPSTKNTREIMKRAGEDDFLSEFYNRSRLHHISTMGALFKRHVSELRVNSDGTFTGMEELEKWKGITGCKGDYISDEPVLMHIDMDCFFVSVGLRNYPELRGKPVVVTHAKKDAKPSRRDGSNREFEFDCYKEHWIKKSKFANDDESTSSVSKVFPRLQDLDETCSMSEIASCSYEARAAGIYNGMFMGAALKLCPSLSAIPYDFEGYKEVSALLYNTVATYTLDIEAVSCDELYAEITSVLRRSGLTPSEFATHLREVIAAKTGCNASVGMGPNMLMARLSTKKAKPNGLFHISKDAMSDFMKTHKVGDLPGVGRSIAHRLHAMGVETCAEMQQVTLGKLQHEFGQKQGQTLYFMCRGDDKRTLNKTGHIRKSISADINYGIRFANEQEMYKFTMELSSEVSKRMEEIHMRGRLLTLKLKIRAKDAPVETAKFMEHGVCDSLSHSITLSAATRDAKIIHKEAMSLLRLLKVDCCELRGMGIQLSKLVVDNNIKGIKQLGQNSLLNFVSRPQKDSADLVGNTEQPPASPEPESVEEERLENRSHFELPSASQIDSSVFDQLPDDLKSDIMQEYQRKGISLGASTSGGEPTAGPSNATEKASEKPTSYEEINQVSDIDASYWSALPDDIKAEIERDIQQRKAAATSPVKDWNSIFKARRSPTKAGSKPGKRKAKIPEASIVKIQPLVSKEHTNDNKEREVTKIGVTAKAEEMNKEVSLSGATTLPEIRQLLIEWFSSTDDPEDEDCKVVEGYLAGLVNNHELHKVEPIILFLNRWSADKNNSWKRAVADIINHTQLYVIQHYNAPMKIAPTVE